MGEQKSKDAKGVGANPAMPGGAHLAGFVNCEETVERLYFYLDGELTEERRVEITRHLDLCGPCVDAFGFEAELRKVIANRCKDHVPETLLDRVAHALRDEHAKHAN